MGFNDFWINNNGKKEQLHDAKHGVRKEQVDKKYHNLFDAYDTNQNGTLEENELSWLLSAVKNAAGEDNTLDDSENAAINARFKEELNIENADFKEFAKSVSKAAEDITSIEEKTNSDGSKSLVTQYKDGTKETITYYADGEYKFKKTEKLHTKTRYWINAKEISKEEYEKALKNPSKVLQRTDTINLSVTNISSNTVTVPEIKEEYSKRFEVEKLLDSICKNLEAGELQKIKERFASLIQQNPEQNWLKIVENAKRVLEKNNMPSTFENLADALESLDINLTIRNEAEYELSSQKREEIELRKFAKEVLSFVYETVSAMQQDYHDNQGLADFGFYSERMSDLICKLGGESDATRSFAQAAKNNLEFAKQAGDIPVINKELFDSEFKKMNGANLDIEGAKKLRDLISKEGFDFQKDIYGEEFNNALKGMLGSSGIESAQSNIETGSILNGLGDIIVMVATLGLAGEAKAVQLFGKTAMQTFGKAGAKLTASAMKLSNPLAKGAMKFAGKVTSLGGGALVGGTHLAAYTGAKETVNNLTNPTRDALSLDTWNMTADAMVQSFGFGAFGGIWGQTVTSKVMNAVNRTSSKTMSALAPKFAEGSVKGVDVLKAFLEKSAPDNIAKAAGFASEVLGFTAYESALSVFLHIDGEVTLDKVTDVLWEEFKNQGYTLGQIKAVSMLLMGSKAARAARTDALESSFDGLKNAEVRKHPEKNEFIVKTADGKSIICKNENEMISACMLLARGGGVNGRVDKDVDVNTETKTSENPVADALATRERAAANGEIPALKDVEFEEGFGLTYKASTNPLSKGDYYLGDKKLASTKKELSAQLKADGIEIDVETERFIEKLKTKEEIQSASAFLYQTKRIPEWRMKYNKLVKEPQDAVILGMLAKQNPSYDYEVAINQIKNNPLLFKLYDEAIPILGKDAWGTDRTYILTTAGECIKTQEQCEGFLHLVKNVDGSKFNDLEQLVVDKLVPNDVKDVDRFLKVIKYTNDRGLRYDYLSLSPEVSEALNPYLETKNDENGRIIHLSEYICDNLIKGLKNPEVRESIITMLKNAPDCETLQSYCWLLETQTYQDKDVIDRLNVLNATGVEFEQYNYAYLIGKRKRSDASEQFEFNVNDDYFNAKIKRLSVKDINEKLGRTMTFDEADRYGFLRKPEQRQYVLSRLDKNKDKASVRNIMAQAEYITTDAQYELADFFIEKDIRVIEFVKNDNLRLVDRDLYDYLKTKEDVKAFMELSRSFPLESQSSKLGYFYRDLMKNGLAKGLDLMKNCSALKNSVDNNVFYGLILNGKDECQQKVLLKLNELVAEKPEFGLKVSDELVELIERIDSKKEMDKVLQNIETLKSADASFLEWIHPNSLFRNDCTLYHLLNSDIIDLNKYNLIRDEVGMMRTDLAEIITSKMPFDSFKKMYEIEGEKNSSILAEICACYTEKTAEFIGQVLKDGIFTPSEMAESLLSVPVFSRMDGTYNARLEFYNEFKTNSRLNHEEFKSVLGQIKDKNMNLALTLCRKQNFPQKMIAPILCSLDGANMEFAAKLCEFDACSPNLMPAILQKYQGGTDEVVFEFIKNGQLKKTPELLNFTTDLWENIINRNLLECDFVDGKSNRTSMISNYARAKTENIAELHRQLVEDAFANKDLLKTGLEDITDRDINYAMMRPETIRALDLIGKGNLEAAFPLMIEEFEAFVDVVDGMKLSDANREALVQKLTPQNSQKYKELSLLIKQYKQQLTELVGAENVAKSEELKAQQAIVEGQLKQLKKSGTAGKQQIKELQTKAKQLGSQAQAIYHQGENATQIKELMKTISNESKNLQQILKENNGIDPQEVVTKLRVLSALSRISTEEEIAEFIDMVKVSTPENDAAWNNAVNKKIFQKLGVEYDEALSQKLDLVNCKYISKMFVSSTAFFRNMKVLVDEIKDNPELTVEQAIDRMPQNVKTKEIFESLGFDYEKFTKVDKNSYESVKIELNGDEAKQAAIRNLEEDLNDELFSSLPKEVTGPIFGALKKELGVTLELSQKENWVGDGFSAGATDYYRLFKNGKPITFDDMDNIVSLIKKEINANDFWSTTQADVNLEIARGTMYTHLIKMRTQEVDNALNIKDGEVAEIEVRKTDMYDVKKALGLGNDAQCCTALGRHFNEWSAPTYIMNKCIGAIELTDKGSFVGNTMIYLAYVDGKPALVLDNIELKTKYQNNDMIRDTFVDYAKRLCNEIGQPDLPIYAGPNRHKLRMDIYSKEAHSMEIIGNSGNQPVYVDYDAGAHYVGQGERVTINMYKLR